MDSYTKPDHRLQSSLRPPDMTRLHSTQSKFIPLARSSEILPALTDSLTASVHLSRSLVFSLYPQLYCHTFCWSNLSCHES